MKERHKCLLPICQEVVEKGFEHVMGLTLDRKREILKYVLQHAEAKSTLCVPIVNAILIELMGPPQIAMDDVLVPNMGNVVAEDGQL